MNIDRYIYVTYTGAFNARFDEAIEKAVGKERVGSGLGCDERQLEFRTERRMDAVTLEALHARVLKAIGPRQLEVTYDAWDGDDEDPGGPIEHLSVTTIMRRH